MFFWLSDDVEYGTEKDGKFIEYTKPKVISEQSCIEFRHGHSFQFMWWIEGIFRENLGKHYNARMYDDGVGDCGVAKPERYETFKSYILNNEINDDDVKQREKAKKWKEYHFDSQREGIPDDLIKSLNLDFEI